MQLTNIDRRHRGRCRTTCINDNKRKKCRILFLRNGISFALGNFRCALEITKIDIDYAKWWKYVLIDEAYILPNEFSSSFADSALKQNAHILFESTRVRFKYSNCDRTQHGKKLNCHLSANVWLNIHRMRITHANASCKGLDGWHGAVAHAQYETRCIEWDPDQVISALNCFVGNSDSLDKNELKLSWSPFQLKLSTDFANVVDRKQRNERNGARNRSMSILFSTNSHSEPPRIS